MSDSAIDLPGIRNITVSGRIASGATTLAKGLVEYLGWKFYEGGTAVEKFYQDKGISEAEVNIRPDSDDIAYDKFIKKVLKEEEHIVFQSHLAGFMAQDIPGVFKILVLCENDEGEDKLNIRIDRLVNRKDITIEEAKQEVHEREEGNLEKWRRLYMPHDKNWVYWDKKYYDLVVNTYNHNKSQSLAIVLKELRITN